MKHLGDITKIHGDKIEPVDCITFGSPCQDLSIAGCRAGLAGERSGLFMEAVRIIKEMRSNTNGLYPTFAVWENVPGAFSSNGGEDFRAVLEELARVEQPDAIIPRPPRGGRWSKAGAIAGNGWSLAWRQLDAQYWGVPQRRKRIALVVDFAGQRAAEILFERTGVPGNPDESIKAWKATPGHSQASPYGRDRGSKSYTLKIRSGCEGGGKGALVQTEKTGTLSTLQDQTLFQPAAAYKVQVLNDQGGGKMDVSYDVVGTLRANAKGHDPIVIDALPFDTTQLTSPQNGSNPHWGDPCHPLAASAHTPSAVVKVYDARGNGNGKVVPTITGDHKGRVTDYTAIVTEPEDCLTPWDNQARRIYSENGTFPALDAREKAGQNQQSVLTETEIRWIVRRLTPTECERLQGYPDGWTDIGEWVDTKGKKHKPADSPRYKALGNSIALPQWFWLVQRMRPYLKEKHTLGSLFDGLGGFPLVWQRAYGEGTARWASEIEEFPMAVTKRRFGEQ